MGVPIIMLKEKNVFELLRRDTPEKIQANKNLLINKIIKTLSSIQNNIFKKAKEFNKKYTSKAYSWKEFEGIALNKGGFIEASWCGSPDCAKGIREIKKYSVRVVNASKSAKKCVHCNNKADYTAVFAPAY